MLETIASVAVTAACVAVIVAVVADLWRARRGRP